MLRPVFFLAANDEGKSFFRLLFEFIKEELLSTEFGNYQHISLVMQDLRHPFGFWFSDFIWA
jgi:hypothetical protein